MTRTFTLLMLLLASRALAGEPPVDTEILTIGIDQPVAGLFLKSESEVTRFQANLTGLGDPIHYKGSRHLELRGSEAEFSAPQPPAPAAAVDLPLNSDRVLVVCMKAKGGPLKMMAYDIAKGRSGAGDYRFFNFSHSTIYAMVGTHKLELQPGVNTVVSDPAWSNDVLELDVQIAMLQDGVSKRAYGSVWGHRPGRRNFVFLFDGAQAYKPVKICRFFDIAADTAVVSRTP